MRPTPPPADVDVAWPPDPSHRHDAAGPADAFPVPFSVAEAFGAVLWTLVAMVIVVQLALLVGVDLGVAAVAVLVVVAGQVFTLAGLVAYLRARGRLSWRLLGPVRPRVRHLAVGAGVGVAGFLLVQVTVAAVAEVLGPFEPPRQSLLEAGRLGGVVTLLAAIAAVVVAPVLEEVVFRGLLFQSLRRRIGLVGALLLSAVVFAVVHLELDQAVFGLALTLLGTWLAVAFHRTGTLLVPIVGHATFNGITLALAVAASG